jgi:hypothetical protein
VELKTIHPYNLKPQEYLFVRIPKTASTSINRVLPYQFPHKTALEWQKELSNFDDLFKFTIVRHPYERFLSMFYIFGVFYRHEIENPNQFLESIDWVEFDKRLDAKLARPQSDYLFDKNNNLMVDCVGRFEELGKHWDYISDKIHVSKILPHARKSRHEKPKLTKNSKQILYKKYQKDFELLGYNK